MQAVRDLKKTQKSVLCDHCGDHCPDNHPNQDKLHFCCNSCQLIYNLLTENGLSQYYSLNDRPGILTDNSFLFNVDVLEDEDVIEKLLSFRSPDLNKLQIELPQIHCSSCVWLLENLHRLNPGIRNARVQYLDKKLFLDFDPKETSLKEVYLLLSRIGYKPDLRLDHLDTPHSNPENKALLYKIGLAGFAFGNIMLLSFPEYLGFEDASSQFYLGYMNLLLATPVLLYSSRDYLSAAWQSLRTGVPGLDVPIAIGMLTLYLRSAYDIFSGTAEGYLDSYTGFVFFLLIGKWFQNLSFNSISFDRNYKSFFPISVEKDFDGKWLASPTDKIMPGDIIRVQNATVIPCDAELISDTAHVDYSFASGEEQLVELSKGQKIYAGGKLHGTAALLKVLKQTDQSYLTQLWNESNYQNDQKNRTTSAAVDVVSRYFTIVVLFIAGITLAYWLVQKPGIAFESFTAVLIIACPCVLALSVPFIYGNALRLLADIGIFVRNTTVLESLGKMDAVVFDKTGTLTDTQRQQLSYSGHALSDSDKSLLRSASEFSQHPLSRAIFNNLKEAAKEDVLHYVEIPGSGIEARFKSGTLRLGSAEFILQTDNLPKDQLVFFELNGEYKGFFHISSPIRKGMKECVEQLEKFYDLALLTGDTDGSETQMKALFPKNTKMLFRCSPVGKLDYIKELQRKNLKVLMVGDGLNDAGALRQSDVGMVISENNRNFTPASDIIFPSRLMHRIDRILSYSNYLKKALNGAFVIALVYNTIGLFLAVTGQLSPVAAAILMPASSIVIMSYGILVNKIYYLFEGNKVE